jgi:hypothetical protein
MSDEDETRDFLVWLANLSDDEITAVAEQLAESIVTASPDPPARCTCVVCGRKRRG